MAPTRYAFQDSKHSVDLRKAKNYERRSGFM